MTLIELACETDFVAKNERFIALADKVADAAAAVKADSVDAALAATAGDKSVEQVISEEAAIIGEKVELRRVRTITGDKVEVYLHRTSKDPAAADRRRRRLLGGRRGDCAQHRPAHLVRQPVLPVA